MENNFKTVCELNKCTGCMACVYSCPKKAVKIKDKMSAYNAIIQEDKCIECNICHNICQQNQLVLYNKPIAWYQGWSNNLEVRRKCSSGGLATEISVAFIKSGGVVCSCCFKNGKFGFEFAETIEELNKFIGSKYVKSNPEHIYKDIKCRIKNNQKVLYIALPCQVAAMKNFLDDKLQKNLYTIDLICHGTPSPKLLNIFLKQYKYSLDDLHNIKFRVKSKFMIYNNYKGVITNGVSDRYSIAFLNSLTYTENCYSCKYAKIERVSDITLGDSWGSELSVEEQKKGISLVLSMTEKGNDLLKLADIHLENVDLNKAIENNHQLKHPSVEPKGRKKFFEDLEKKKFNTLIFKLFPKQCLRQNIKQILIKMKIINWSVK